MIKNLIAQKAKYIFIASFFIILGILFSNNAAAPQKKYAEIANNGWQWLYNYQGKFLDPGVLFIIKTINEDYCQSSPKVESFWRDKLTEFEDHAYLPVFERLFADENYKISDKVISILQTPQEYYNDVLPQAMYCDIYPVKEDFEEETFSGIKNEKESGYDLTHKFWSAILFRDNDCSAENYNVGEIIASGAKQIAVEQQKIKEDKFDDLYAERTAMLLNFGFQNLVEDKWIENIIKNQKPSGAWATPGLYWNETENPHTTILSIWALSQYSNICPFQ